MRHARQMIGWRAPPRGGLGTQLQGGSRASRSKIADRLGRAPATVKAYFYDPSEANKGPSWERDAEPGGRELRSHPPAAASREDVLPPTDVLLRSDGCPAPPVGWGF
jgi:hypothetical protein